MSPEQLHAIAADFEGREAQLRALAFALLAVAGLLAAWLRPHALSLVASALLADGLANHCARRAQVYRNAAAEAESEAAR